MKRLTIIEHEHINIGDAKNEISEPLFKKLHKFDVKYSENKSEGQRIFNWGDRYFKAKQWVGVIQIPGLNIEILPKIESNDNEVNNNNNFARKNLLYMLSIAIKLPFKERDLAVLDIRNAPLFETLIRIFATRLQNELVLGVNKFYIDKEENLNRLKGKIVFNKHIQFNAAHKEKFFVKYQDFLDDIPLNRILKAACNKLINITNSSKSQEKLKHCLLLLCDVRNVNITIDDFNKISLTRQNERFQEVFTFCKLILFNQTPSASSGKERTFSLLFDMNNVFEDFIAQFMKKYCMKELKYSIYPQGKGHHKAVFTKNGKDKLYLKPDILLINDKGANLIIDTKWKRPVKQNKLQVSRDDYFQMFVYAHRYKSAKNILLFPSTLDTDINFEENLTIIDDNEKYNDEKQVKVKFIDLSRDLKQNRESLKTDLIALTTFKNKLS